MKSIKLLCCAAFIALIPAVLPDASLREDISAYRLADEAPQGDVRYRIAKLLWKEGLLRDASDVEDLFRTDNDSPSSRKIASSNVGGVSIRRRPGNRLEAEGVVMIGGIALPSRISGKMDSVSGCTIEELKIGKINIPPKLASEILKKIAK